MEGPWERIFHLLEMYWQNKKKLKRVHIEDLYEEKKFLKDQLRSLQKKRNIFVRTGSFNNEIKREALFYQRVIGRSDFERIRKVLVLYHFLSTNDGEVDKLLRRVHIPKKDRKTLEYIERLRNNIASRIDRYINNKGDAISLLVKYGDSFLNMEKDMEDMLKTLIKNLDIGLDVSDIIAVKNALQYERMNSIKDYRRNSMEVPQENVLEVIDGRIREVKRRLDKIEREIVKYHELRRKISVIEDILMGKYRLLKINFVDPDVLEELITEENGDINRKKYEILVHLLAFSTILLELKKIAGEVIKGKKKKIFLDILGMSSFILATGDLENILRIKNLDMVGERVHLKSLVEIINPRYESIVWSIVNYIDRKMSELLRISPTIHTENFRETIVNIVDRIYKKIRRIKDITKEKEEEFRSLLDSIREEIRDFTNRLYERMDFRYAISPMIIDFFGKDISNTEIPAIETIFRKYFSENPLENLEAVMIYKYRNINNEIRKKQYLRGYKKHKNVFNSIEEILGNIALYFFLRKDAGEGI